MGDQSRVLLTALSLAAVLGAAPGSTVGALASGVPASPAGANEEYTGQVLTGPAMTGQAMHPARSGAGAVIGAGEVFIVLGARPTRELAILMARQYALDFRSAAVVKLRDGRWSAVAGWTGRDEAGGLIRDLGEAGRVPRGSFAAPATQIDTLAWSATGSLDRESLRIPANVRRTSLLAGLGAVGDWGASGSACQSGPAAEDLLESRLRIGERGMQWGALGACSFGSMVRATGGAFIAATCGEGRANRFVMSLHRRGPRLEIVTDPDKPNRISYEMEWCPRQGPALAGPARASDPGRSTALFPRQARLPAARSRPPQARPAPLSPPPVAAARPRSTGSGFFVTTDGHLVTNAHVVRACGEIRVDGHGAARLLRADEDKDLALLKVAPRKPVAHVRVSPARAQLGQEVVVFGFPLSGILNNGLNVTTGIISSETGIANDRRIVQFTAAIQPGNSGGPILDVAGNLLAVVKAKFSDRFALNRGNFVPQNLNFGIDANVLAQFLARNGVKVQSAPEDAPTRTVAELAAVARSHTMLVSCH